MNQQSSKQLSPSLQVRKMTLNDIPKVASLHRKIFTDYFLTHMGQRFLELFYMEFVDRTKNYGVVAVNGNEPVGFVVGTSDSAALYRNFYRNHFALLFIIGIERFLNDTYIRNNIIARLSHVQRAFSSALFGNTRHMTTTNPSPSTLVVRLLSIGVDPQFRGQKIADELVKEFCILLQRDGIQRVGLTVRVSNDRAIGFYEKNGWARETTTSTTIAFSRSTLIEM